MVETSIMVLLVFPFCGTMSVDFIISLFFSFQSSIVYLIKLSGSQYHPFKVT